MDYIDGYETYATADLQLSYKYNVSGASLVSPGRFGGSCLLLSTAGSQVFYNGLPQSAFRVMGFAFKRASIGTAGYIAVLGDFGVANQHLLKVNADGTLSILKGDGGSLTGGTSTWVMAPNRWYYLEWKMETYTSIDPGSCQLYVDGQAIINLVAGQSTQVGHSYTNCFLLYNDQNINQWYDDLYVAGGDIRYGPQRVIARFPNGNGANTSWLYSGGASAWQSVNEVNQDGDATYIYGNTVGDTSTFTLSPLSVTTTSVNGIQIRNVSAKGDSAFHSVVTMIRHLGTNYSASSGIPLDTAYGNYTNIWETQPGAGGKWTVSSANALEAGLQVTN